MFCFSRVLTREVEAGSIYVARLAQTLEAPAFNSQNIIQYRHALLCLAPATCLHTCLSSSGRSSAGFINPAPTELQKPVTTLCQDRDPAKDPDWDQVRPGCSSLQVVTMCLGARIGQNCPREKAQISVQVTSSKDGSALPCPMSLRQCQGLITELRETCVWTFAGQT